jgi:hypothetical protein
MRPVSVYHRSGSDEVRSASPVRFERKDLILKDPTKKRGGASAARARFLLTATALGTGLVLTAGCRNGAVGYRSDGGGGAATTAGGGGSGGSSDTSTGNPTGGAGGTTASGGAGGVGGTAGSGGTGGTTASGGTGGTGGMK